MVWKRPESGVVLCLSGEFKGEFKRSGAGARPGRLDGLQSLGDDILCDLRLGPGVLLRHPRRGVPPRLGDHLGGTFCVERFDPKVCLLSRVRRSSEAGPLQC